MWYHFLFCLPTLISAEIITLIKDNNVTCVVTEKPASLQPYIDLDGTVIDYNRNKTLEKIDTEWSNDDWNNSTDPEESYFEPVVDSRWENFSSSKCNRGSSISTKKWPSVSFSICVTKDLNFIVKNGDKTKNKTCRLNTDKQLLTGKCVWYHFTIKKTNTSNNVQFISEKGIVRENCSPGFDTTLVILPECLRRKLHKYTFRSSSLVSKNQSSLSVTSSENLCLYVSVDENCFLNITLKTKSTIINTTTIQGFNKKNEPRKWKFIEIKGDSNGTGTLSFFRGHNHNNSRGYWAIDDIKSCRSIELHQTTLPKNSPKKQLCVPLEKENATSEVSVHCPTGYLGKNCTISCSEVLGESNSTCEKYKICNGDNCTCSWGYQGPNCDKRCSQNYWGLNCTSRCDPWCKTCNYQNGCLETLPYLLNTPVLKSLTNSSVNISIEDPSYKNDTITIKPEYFQIQYKKDGENVFQNYSTRRNFSHIREEIKIPGLSINTSDYKVRVLLIVDNNFYERVPELKIYKRSLSGTLYSSYNDESHMKLTWNDIRENNSTDVTYNLQYECNRTFCSSDNVSSSTKTTDTTAEISNLKNSTSCNVQLFSLTGDVRRLIDEIVVDHNDTDINDNELPRNITFVNKHFQMELPECENFKSALVYHLKWLNKSEINDFTKYDNQINIPVGDLANYSPINLTVTGKRFNKTKEKTFIVHLPKSALTTVQSQKSMRLPTTTTKPKVSLVSQAKKGGLEILIIILISAVVTLCLVCLLILYACKKLPFQNIDRKNDQFYEIQPFVEYSDEDVEIKSFDYYLLTSIGKDYENNELQNHYQKVPMNFDIEKVHGTKPENTNKNRYKNIVPYDSTRVVLKDPDGDYINANYIDGYEAPRAFIATQAPLPDTINDFWSMVWQEKASTIVMLTKLVENGRVKCEKYWPEDSSHIKFGKFVIENTSTLEYPDYVERKLKVKVGDETHLVDHLQYTTWPDHGVPRNVQDFTAFMKKFVALPRSAPIVVHCNAGCGRTGTIILCDIALRMAAKEHKVNFSKILQKMRHQRPNQVTCVEQYIFAHFVVLECIWVRDFSIPVDDGFQGRLQKALKYPSMKSLMGTIHRVTERCEKTNFWTKSSTAEDDKVSLSDLQRLMNNNNAVSVDGYRFPSRFVVTQQPLPNTVADFWELVQTLDVTLIVSLNEVEDKDPRCPMFWPRHSNDTLSVQKNKVLHFHSERFYRSHNEIRVNYDNEKDVIIMDVKNWKRETLTPKSSDCLIWLWKEICDQQNRILVTCYDGITASGLFVALSFLIEKIDKENVCDVFTAVRTVKNSRVECLRDPVHESLFVSQISRRFLQVQVKFLYTAAQKYVKAYK